MAKTNHPPRDESCVGQRWHVELPGRPDLGTIEVTLTGWQPPEPPRREDPKYPRVITKPAGVWVTDSLPAPFRGIADVPGPRWIEQLA